MRGLLIAIFLIAAASPVWSADPPSWIKQQKLAASDAAPGDAFGYSVAVDGDTAVVGAYNKQIGPNPQQGSVYVFVRKNGVWTQQQELIDPGHQMNDFFGLSVAISGDTAVIGANVNIPDLPADPMGVAYVFVRSGEVWTLQTELALSASDATTNVCFGCSLSVNGDTAVIGAYRKNAAYVFVRSGGVWHRQQELTASDTAHSVCFAASVSVSGDTTLIGDQCKEVGSHANQGAAYAFVRSGGVWTQQQEITEDGAVGDDFGHSIAVSGDTAVIGTPGKSNLHAQQGAAYIFERKAGVWSRQQTLTASDGAKDDQFGLAVSVSGDTAVIGAELHSIGQGAAYVFERSGTVWTLGKELEGAKVAHGNYFGGSVSVSAHTALIGASEYSGPGDQNPGAAYVFVQ